MKWTRRDFFQSIFNFAQMYQWTYLCLTEGVSAASILNKITKSVCQCSPWDVHGKCIMVHMNWSITENLSTLCISISWRKRKISRHITSILYKSPNVRTFFFLFGFLELIRSNSYACVIDQVSFGYSAIPFWPKFSTHHDVMSFFWFHSYAPQFTRVLTVCMRFFIVCAKCLLYRIILFCFFLRNTMGLCNNKQFWSQTKHACCSCLRRCWFMFARAL